MRICIAHSTIGDHDGSSRYLADVARFFAEQGHQVSIAAEWTRTEKPPGPLDSTGPFDVVFATDRAPKIAAKRFLYAPLDLFGEGDEREALQRCDVLLRFTNAAVRALEDRYGLELASKSLAVPYVSREFENHPQPEFVRARNRLLWVGRLIPGKGIDFLVRAVKLLQAPGWELRVCGTGPERERLEQQAASYPVDFGGFVEHLGPEYEAAKLFLTASPDEHFSLTLMEAYVHGTPCLGRRPDGKTVRNSCDVQIVDGKTGYLFSTEQELAAQIDELLTDEPRRLAMARAGWRRKRDEFTLDAFHAALHEALRRVSD